MIVHYNKENIALNILLLSSKDSSLQNNKLRFTQSNVFLKSINAQKVESLRSFLFSIIVVKVDKWSIVLRPFLKPSYSSFITSMPSSLIINRAVSTPQYSLYTTGDKIKPLHDIESIGSDVDDFGIGVIMPILHIASTLQHYNIY